MIILIIIILEDLKLVAVKNRKETNEDKSAFLQTVRETQTNNVDPLIRLFISDR